MGAIEDSVMVNRGSGLTNAVSYRSFCVPFGIDCAVMPVSKAWFRLERGRQDAWSENMTIFLGSVLCR